MALIFWISLANTKQPNVSPDTEKQMNLGEHEITSHTSKFEAISET